MNKSMMKEEVTKHLTEGIIPFWKALRDDTYGGYYGYMDYDLNVDKTAEKGCILNSRITWFFANAYILLKDEPYWMRQDTVMSSCVIIALTKKMVESSGL